MSKGPLLPTNMPTMKPAVAPKAGVFPTRKLAAGLLLITSFNLLIWRNPQLSFYYFSNIHHKVSSWTSVPTFLEDVLIHPSVSTSSHPVAAGPSDTQAYYPWTPSGREAPLAPEPGIDVPDTFDPTPYSIHEIAPKPARKMTGEPGMDVWNPEEGDEGSVFATEGLEVTGDEQAPLDWLSIAEVLNVDLTGTKQDDSPPIDLDEIAKLLDEYAYADGDATAVTGEMLSPQIIQRLEWEALQNKEGE